MKLNLENTKGFYTEEEFNNYLIKAKAALKVLNDRSGDGNDFLGWVDYPVEYDKEELERIKAAAQTINRTSDCLVVIGIGGSYLGAKAVIDCLTPYFSNNHLEVIFAGTSLSSTYLTELRDYLWDKDFSVNVISKSGTTTEPALTYRFLHEILKKKYFKDEFSEHIFYTTDKEKGALHQMGVEEGIEMFTVPSDMGGRYSVFSGVGLLPIAAAGYDVDKLLKGARQAYDDLKGEDSDAVKYAALRNLLYDKGFGIEMLESYEPSMSNFAEWWKQLFGESEGKDHKGIFPASAIFTRDLHSLGQFIQEGTRNLFETLITINDPKSDFDVPFDKDNLDGLNYLVGKSINDVNNAAINGTINAHVAGGVPVINIELEELDAYNIGYAMYFFMKACAISGYTLGVNPFNQPGVEAYKSNMFKILKKPGYEEK